MSPNPAKANATSFKPKRKKTGGRKTGTPNKATQQREALARAQVAESLAKSKKAGQADPKVAINELYKAIQIAEGMSGLLQPAVTRDEQTGAVTFKGGDAKLFGEWFDRWKDCVLQLLPYQQARIKPVDMPTAPPSAAEIEAKSRRKFGLRVFDGGRQVRPLSNVGEDEKAS